MDTLNVRFVDSPLGQQENSIDKGIPVKFSFDSALSRFKSSPLQPYVQFGLIVIPLLSISRLVLQLWQSARVTAVDGWITILLQGVRVDVATVSMLLFVPILISILLSGPARLLALWNRIVQIWLTLLVYFILFMELATPSFINEYNIRPNRIFIEYLIYPKEVFSMLFKSHFFELIGATAICILLARYSWKRLGQTLSRVQPIRWRYRPVVFLAVLFLLAIGGRSTFGHRPLNPAMVYFSTDPLVNSLTLNSLYSAAFAARQMLSEESSQYLYGEMSEKEIISKVREIKGLSTEAFVKTEIPTLAMQRASFRGKPKNLVIILEESLGARFVGSLGGLPLTPNLDLLSEEGWFFESMLATGTRSVRGIEAVITGFTPTPDRAVVKLDKSQKNFYSIAETLKRSGYHTEFIYGGEAHFDNMKSFFLGNGFDYITEEKDYENPEFVGSWGVSDEDLFAKANDRFSQLSDQGRPFFSLVFSSSNHTPFEFPDGRIELLDSQKNTRHNAIRYADWALGRFIESAKKSNYWNNTVFLIIADHDAKAQGEGAVPVKAFHIPALILGEGIKPRKEVRFTSQLDMPPTLLSLIGIDNLNPMIGQDLTKSGKNEDGRAFMQFGQNFGYLENNQLTILQPQKPALSFRLEQTSFALSPLGQAGTETAKLARALANWGKLAYHNQYYRLPDQPPASRVKPPGIATP